MSPKEVVRASALCLLALVAAGPAAADITFWPSPMTVAVGQSSEVVTANITYLAGTDHLGGQQTLNLDYLSYYGLSTDPSPVTYTVAPHQPSATVSFRVVAASPAASSRMARAYSTFVCASRRFCSNSCFLACSSFSAATTSRRTPSNSA